jgi:hypothetical protein
MSQGTVAVEEVMMGCSLGLRTFEKTLNIFPPPSVLRIQARASHILDKGSTTTAPAWVLCIFWREVNRTNNELDVDWRLRDERKERVQGCFYDLVWSRKEIPEKMNLQMQVWKKIIRLSLLREGVGKVWSVGSKWQMGARSAGVSTTRTNTGTLLATTDLFSGTGWTQGLHFESLHQPFLWWVFLRWGLINYFAQTGLEPRSSWSLPSE